MGIFGRVFGKDFANLLQRVAGDAVGGELAQQIASKFVLTCLRAKLNLFKDQLRTELTKVADVLLQVFALGECLDNGFELGAGIAVALAIEEEAHDLEAAFEIA